jgi:hypothetical protein
MVIATSGYGSSISYTRIISSTSSPYSVVISDSKTFRDSTLDINKSLRGLFVVDKNNLVALIWNYSNSKTDVATLNLVTPSVSYQPSLPNNNMYTGVFVSASVYYTASWYNYFSKDYTNWLSLNNNYYQGIVYTSNMSMS